MSLRNNADFIALCVGDGDAFLLARGDDTILVDGGRKNKNFPDLVRQDGGVSRLDVVVCTHNDGDHAGGILSLLQQGFDVGELWLPASWASRLPGVVLNPSRILLELFLDLREKGFVDDRGRIANDAIESVEEIEVSSEREGEDYPWTPVLEACLAVRAKSEVRAVEENPSLHAEIAERREDEMGAGEVEDVDTLLAEDSAVQALYQRQRNIHHRWAEYCSSMDVEPSFFPPWHWYSDQYFDLRGRDPNQWHYTFAVTDSVSPSLFLQSVKQSIDNLRQIATWAYARGVPIRWFEYTTGTPSGGRQDFKPVNSVEKQAVYQPGIPILEYVALTTQNEESLVFYAPASHEESSEPGVLFTADSLLEPFESNIPHDSNMLVTTPHHGSVTNESAYSVIQRKTGGDPVWIRSGPKANRYPSDAYIQLSDRKACTRCRTTGRGMPEQSVHAQRMKGQWTLMQGTEKCSCDQKGYWPTSTGARKGSPPPCKGKCKDGTLCKRKTWHYTGFCRDHREQSLFPLAPHRH